MDDNSGEPGLSDDALSDARRLATLPQLLADPEPVDGVVEGHVETEKGVRVPVRVYRSEHGHGCVLVYLHGGGWVAGSVRASDFQARRLANRLGALVLSVGYRRAPEHPFPAGLVDACMVLWAAVELDGRHPVVVMGESAGANLAASACLALRDMGPGDEGAHLMGQVLVCPATDLEWSGTSFEESGDPELVESLRRSGEAYLGSGAGTALQADGYVSPLRAGDLQGLPPAVVITAELDPLRDQGEEYARRLAAAGNTVHSRRIGGADHGFFSAPQDEDAMEAFDAAVELIADALGLGPSG